jgi:predicted ribosome quality control (RQC) complex YloA/Tae2 family protein
VVAQPSALEPLAALRAQGDRMLEALGVSALERQKLALVRALRAAARRLERRLAAIEQDRARVDRVDELRRNAGLLLTHLHELERDGGGVIALRDESVDPPVSVEVEVDPALGPRRQAEVWFSAARKLERGATIAAARAHATQAEIAKLHALSARATAAAEPGPLTEVADEARELGVAVDPGIEPGRRKQPRARLPYRQFLGSGGRAILVGKGAEDNDQLTLQHARPHDLWLHARDDAGAHVVVPLERGEACPSELLCDAATLAAHFSQARGHARVDVLYTERRYVRKPRKIGAGKVVLMREKVFRLQLQPERLARLLAAERAPTQA